MENVYPDRHNRSQIDGHRMCVQVKTENRNAAINVSQILNFSVRPGERGTTLKSRIRGRGGREGLTNLGVA